MCKSDLCRKYNRSWTCPPACGSLSDCEKKARQYSFGILVQSVGEVEDSFDIESMKRIESLHKKRFLSLVQRLRSQNFDILPLGSGACTVCAECTYPDSPCRFPEKAIVSMEAYGLWISDICENNGVKYNYGERHLAFTSCILAK